jgi:hypothetical protein
MSDLNFIIVALLFNICCRSEVKMAQNNGDFTAKGWRAVRKYLFLKGTQPKRSMMICRLHYVISALRTPLSVTGFRTGHLITADEERSGRPTQAAVPENVDAIHSMILDDRRISAKIISETLAMPRERAGYIIHEILDMRNLSAKWAPRCLNADQKGDRILVHKPFWTDFGEILWNFLTVS